MAEHICPRCEKPGTHPGTMTHSDRFGYIHGSCYPYGFDSSSLFPWESKLRNDKTP